MVGLKLAGEYISPLGTHGLATIQIGAEKVIRAYGTMPHPNVLGVFLVLGIVCGLYLVARGTNSRIPNVGLRIGLILLLIGLFTTFSRLAWIAGLIAVSAFLIYDLRINRRTFVAILICVIVSCATIFGFYHNYLNARVAESSATSINDRYFFNLLGLDLTQHYPVLGVGAGNYVEALKDLYPLEDWQNQPAHNIFIFVAAELGLLGLGLFVMILFEIFGSLKNSDGGVLTFSLGLIGFLFLLMSQFDHYSVTIQQGRLMFAVMLGLIAALPNLYDQKAN